MSTISSSPYAGLVNESVPYAVWAAEYGPRFLEPAWLADSALMCIPTPARAVFERKAGDGTELKVYIGPAQEKFTEFYAAGGVELPLTHPNNVVVADLASFTERLGSSGGVYKHATFTQLPAENGPVPATYRCVTRGADVPDVTVTVLSSGFADATARSEWQVRAGGAYASMSFFLQLVHNRAALLGSRVEACVSLERSIMAAKKRKSELFHGPAAPTTSTYSGKELGFLCARYHKGPQELLLHLSEPEFEKMCRTFPVLCEALTTYERTGGESAGDGSQPYFYKIPFRAFQCTKADGWVGRVQLDIFLASREPSLPNFLLLHATYVDL